MHHKETEIIETERLLLRKLVLTDVEDMYEWLNDAEVVKQLPSQDMKTSGQGIDDRICHRRQ